MPKGGDSKMPKIVQYKLPPGGTVIDLADNQSTALEIEGVDSKDYLIVTTTDGSEAITIKGGGSAGLAVHENNQVRSTVGDGWVFLSSDPTDTSPNICPSQKDLDTGIGHGDGGNTNSDQLSLIAGGVEGIRLTETGGTVTVSISGPITHTGNVEIENASPTLTFDNTTAEDTDGGRESQMDFTGLKTGSGSPAAVTMARVQGSHDGTGDDSKGKISFLTSDGSSLAERFRIHNDGKVGLGSAGLSRSELFCVRQAFTGGEELVLIENTGDGNALTVQAASGTASTKVFDVKRAAGSMLTAFGDGKITTGGETSALCKAGGIHLLTGTQTGGTASTDAQDLVIESNATEIGLTLLGSNTHRSRIQFADVANNASAGISFNHSTNDMFFWNDGSAQSMYFLDEGYLQVNLATPTAMVAAEGNLITQGAGTIESISTATVTGSGTSFTTVLQAGDAIKFTNDAGGTEIRTVKQINSNTELVLTETPGATGAGRGTKTYFIDPALFSLTTGDAVSKFSVKKSGVGVNVADPDFPLHVVGPGGGQDLSGISDAAVTDGKFSAMFDNGTANGADRNIVGINTNGDGGSLLNLYQNGAQKASFFAYDSGHTYLDAKAGELHLRTTANHKMDFHTNNTSRMVIDADGAVAVGSAATSNSSHEFEVNSGSNFLYFNITGSQHYVVGNRKVNFYGGGESVNSATFAKYGTQMLRFAMAESDGSRTSDTNADQPAYLADSGATIICDLNFGCVGAFTLTADVTHVKFWNVPNLGTAQTITVKIKQHASSPKTISYSTVNIYRDAGSNTNNGSLLWSGGASHVMSTGVDDIDIVQFTVIPTSEADRDVYGAVIGQNFS